MTIMIMILFIINIIIVVYVYTPPTEAAALKSPVVATSVAARRGYVQQDSIDDPFRQELMRALRNPRLEASVDLAAAWKDSDDAEDWLQVSEEELDREMAARQAEFDAYDKRRAAAKDAQKTGASGAANPEDMAKEFAAMGSQITGMLERLSSVDGVDPYFYDIM